jgi:hypothetical protein
MNRKPDRAPGRARRSGVLILKIVVSGWILFHLLAVVLPPLAFQAATSEGPSPLMRLIIQPFEGYGQFLHINRGYAFFAPDPGPSRLIQAAVVEEDGTVTEKMFPDLEAQWPRLLYHRHFMLTEYLSNIYRPPGPPEELFEVDADGAKLWQRERARYEYVRQSMIEHLRHQFGDKEVAIRRIEHGLPSLADFRKEPIELDDPRLYRVLLDQPVFSETFQTDEDSEANRDGPQAEAASGEEAGSE